MIRIATEADVPRMLQIYGPYIENTTYSFEYEVPSQEAFLQRFRDLTAQFPWLVWEEEGVVLGYAYGSAPFARDAYRWCTEDSLYLEPCAQGRGIGSRLLRALERVLAYQGYRRIYALITSENKTSLAFHRKAGYEFTAEFKKSGYKFGKELGVTWMEKELNSGGFPSNFPISWPELMQDGQKISDILDILSLS